MGHRYPTGDTKPRRFHSRYNTLERLIIIVCNTFIVSWITGEISTEKFSVGLIFSAPRAISLFLIVRLFEGSPLPLFLLSRLLSSCHASVNRIQPWRNSLFTSGISIQSCENSGCKTWGRNVLAYPWHTPIHVPFARSGPCSCEAIFVNRWTEFARREFTIFSSYSIALLTNSPATGSPLESKSYSRFWSLGNQRRATTLPRSNEPNRNGKHCVKLRQCWS